MSGVLSAIKKITEKVKKNRKRNANRSSTGSSVVESGFEERDDFSESGSDRCYNREESVCSSDEDSTLQKYFRNLSEMNSTCDNQVGQLLKNDYPCTIGEVNGRNPSGMYNVLISCSMDNKPKVMKLVGHLERQGLKVCLPERDLLVGLSLPIVIPELVEDRCRYTILCLSRSFFNNKECLFQTEIAQWLSAGERWKKCLLVKLEDYEDAVSREHSAFKTLFNLCCVIDLSTKEAWEFPNLIDRLKA